jgi:uncharacterized heparinase superfamily protein
MNLPRLLRTIRHLKLRQFLFRLVVIVKPRFIPRSAMSSTRNRVYKWVLPVAKPQTMFGPREFRILNQIINVRKAQDWNDATRDKLLLYHLHYVGDLNAINAASRAEWHSALIDQWIDQNPPLAGNGWEPYPLSLRIVNLVKWSQLGSELSGSQLLSLWRQAGVMSQSIEHHLQANHVLANAKALYFAGCFFSGTLADRWRKKGTSLLASQLAEQILPDGGHFERSPMYHAVILEDVLDIISLGRCMNVELPNGAEAFVSNMLVWLGAMTHPDGEPAYFNDSVAGNTVTFDSLLDYANRLGFSANIGSGNGLSVFANSGYFRFTDNDLSVFVDAGPIGPDFQPGHAHCDALSFELSVGLNRVFVNTGISTYNDNARRRWERGTAAHNTVSIAGLEQNEVWGAFRVGRRARIFGLEVGDQHVVALHDGYRSKGIEHCRRFDFLDKQLLIRDKLLADEPVAGVAHFHCFPGLEPILEENDISVAGLKLSFENASRIELSTYEYCDGFNSRRHAKEIAVTFESTLASRISYESPLHIG